MKRKYSSKGDVFYFLFTWVIEKPLMFLYKTIVQLFKQKK